MLTASDGRLVVVGQPEAPAVHSDRHASHDHQRRRRPVINPAFSWNLVADIRTMWAYPFMVNAFRAGAVVAVVAGVIGWFMVLRRQTFAGHTLALSAFPGPPGPR